MTAQPFYPVNAAHKIIERAETSPDVKRVEVGVDGLVAICEALLAASEALKLVVFYGEKPGLAKLHNQRPEDIATETLARFSELEPPS